VAEPAATTRTTPTRTTKDLAKVAVSGWLGTAMEFMDFQLYSLAAALVFNEIFFPNVSPAIGLIAAMATYGVGYVARLAAPSSSAGWVTGSAGRRSSTSPLR
jgi:MHS family metabolite:H+ symporter-like MFS transporter